MANVDIKYINKDFSDFKNALIEYSKNYFSEIYNDFTEATPGNMFIEMAAYVGDVLSFYIDKQTQENFLLYAQDKQNLISMAYALGYKPKVVSTAVVELDIFQQLPAKITGGVASPDYEYCLIVNEETKIKSASKNDVVFITQDSVDFSFSSSYDPTEISVYQINNSTNQPEYYLLKKKVKAIAGEIKTQTFTFGNSVKFNTVSLQDTNVIEILDAVDSDGYKWYEVPYLAQSTILDSVKNNEINNPAVGAEGWDVPYILRLKKINRRFVSRYNSDNTLTLEFGSGINSFADEEIVPNPDNVGMGLVDSISKMYSAYDPSNFLYTQDYGLAPSNITLTVKYLVGGGVQTNVPSNDITTLYELNLSTVSLNTNSLNVALLGYIRNSVYFNNTAPASGGGEGDTNSDLRLKTIANFPTQLRNVTKEDHIIRALSMPPKYGTVAKAYITQDMALNKSSDNVDYIDDNPLSLSLYILSYDIDKKLTNSSITIKKNLKNYLSQYRILTDAINVKDAYYINIGLNFDIIVLPSYNGKEVLNNCLTALKDYFNIDKWQINQPILITEIQNTIGMVRGVQSVVRIDVVNKYGVSSGYSKYGYDIKGATKNNIIYPSLDPSIFEVRYPDNDIYGRIVTY